MKPLRKRVLSSILLTLLVASLFIGLMQYSQVELASAAWYDPSGLDDYTYRKSHVIENATGAGTNYPVQITVNLSSGADSGNTVYLNDTLNPFVTFTDNDGTTELDKWLESSNVTETPLTLNTSGICQAPDGTLYAAQGKSIYKSSDDGQTWSSALKTLTGTNTYIPLIWVADNGYVYFSAGNSDVPDEDRGLWRSTNQGTDWTRVITLTGSGYFAWAIDENSTGAIFAGSYSYLTETARIFRSTNNGASFSQVYESADSLHFHDIKVDRVTGYIYAVRGEPTPLVLRSTDGGDNWTQIHSDDGLPQLLAIGISPTCRVYGSDATNGLIYRSTDDLTTTQVLDSGINKGVFTWIRYDPLTLKFYASVIDETEPTAASRIYVSDDDGVSWSIYKSFTPTLGWDGSSWSSSFRHGKLFFAHRDDGAYTNGIMVKASTLNFWVEVADSLESSNQTIYIYYGKSGGSTISNGTNTFTLFDDFNDGTINTDIWNTSVGTGTVTEANGYAVVTPSGGVSKQLQSQSTFGLGTRLYCYGKGDLSVSGDQSFQFGFVGTGAEGTKCSLNELTATYFQLRTNDGTDTYVNTDIPNDSNFHTFDVRRDNSSSATLLIDGGHTATSNTHISVNNLKIQFYAYNTGALSVSYAFITKFVSPEPQHGAWGSEEEQDFTSPTFASLSSSTTVASASCQFNSTWTDETSLATTGGYIFSTNNTGLWVNDTWSAFSSNPQAITVSKTLNSTVGAVIQWLYYANDTSNNWNATALQNITITAADTYTLSASWDSPTNTTYPTSTVNFNVTTTGNETGVTRQIQLLNGTSPVGANQTSASGSWINLVNGTYTACVTVGGDHGATDYETIIFSVGIYVDLEAPTVTLISPANSTHTSSSIALTFSVSETASWSGYSLSGTANVTSGNATLADFVNGTYNIRVYANDSSGNMGASSLIYFSIEISEGETITIIFVHYDEIGGTITPTDGTYNYTVGQVVTLSAVPATNYAFMAWLQNGTKISTANPYNYTVTVPCTITAILYDPTTKESALTAEEALGVAIGLVIIFSITFSLGINIALRRRRD